MLIIEGSDCVGKTTLCKRLIEELNAQGFPVIPQHFGKLENSWDFYWDYLKFVNNRVIMDRFIMSEVVYGDVIRYGVRIKPEWYRMIDAHVRLHGGVTVVVTMNSDMLKRKLEQDAARGQMFSREQIIAVNEGFRQLVQRSKYQEYAPDFDVQYEVSDDECTMPSSNDVFVNRIIKLYVERQRAWYELHDRLLGQEEER